MSTARTTPGPELHAERQRSIMVGWLLGVADLIPSTIAAVIANSVVLWATLARGAIETAANISAWLTIRKVRQGGDFRFNYGYGKLENLSSLLVAVALLISSGVFMFLAVDRFRHPEPANDVWLGILIEIVAVILNGRLWFQNRRLAAGGESPVMEAQWRLFRSKTFINACILAALAGGALFRDHAWAALLDPVATLLVTAFLAYSALAILSSSVPGLVDRALDDSLDELITGVVLGHRSAYDRLVAVDARRSGGDIFIEVQLAFDGQRLMSEVQGVMDAVRHDLEGRVAGSHAFILPRPIDPAGPHGVAPHGLPSAH